MTKFLKHNYPLLLKLSVYIILVGLVLWWTVAQWNECRSMGFSIFYCLQHIG